MGFSLGYRKTERIPDGQSRLSGFEHFSGPQPKFRAKRPYAARSFGHYVPANKSVDDTSLVTLCCGTNELTRGTEEFPFGRRPIRLYCENLYAPYKSGQTIVPRIISLLLPTERQAAPGRSLIGYQLETL